MLFLCAALIYCWCCFVFHSAEGDDDDIDLFEDNHDYHPPMDEDEGEVTNPVKLPSRPYDGIDDIALIIKDATETSVCGEGSFLPCFIPMLIELVHDTNTHEVSLQRLFLWWRL